MNKKKDKYLYIFLHVPKTGGTTFSNHIEHSLKRSEIFSTSKLRYDHITSRVDKEKVKVVIGHASYYGIHKLFPGKVPRYILFLRDPAERIVSSYNFDMRNRRGKIIPFWKWYSSQLKNETVYFLDLKFRGKEGSKADLPRPLVSFFAKISKSKRIFLFFQKIYGYYISLFRSSESMNKKRLENAKELVDNCWHIGFVSNLDSSLKEIFKEMKLPTKWSDENVTHKRKNFFKLDGDTRKKLYLDNKYEKELFDYALSKK